MKAILSLRKRHYLKTISIFLVAVILIVGVASCEGEPEILYEMSVGDCVCGDVIVNSSTLLIPAGEIIVIEAVAHDCCRFVNWQAPAGTLGDANNSTTTFTMPAQDVTVTANFEAVPPDHYKFYEVYADTAPYIGKEVELVDQFGAFTVTVGDAVDFGNPVEKIHNDVVTPISDLDRHYTIYLIDYGEEEPMLGSWKVTINNQFQDDVELTVQGPVALAVPTQKEDHEAPTCLNHFLIYLVTETEFPEFSVHLKDQFTEEDVVVRGPTWFANPVQKTVDGVVTEIEDPDEHWVAYLIEGEPIETSIQIDNQFGEQTLNLFDPDFLTLPSQQISWEQPLDHFWVYWSEEWAGEPPATFPVEVQLEDQFITDWLGEPLSANVTTPELFANPVDKKYGDVLTPISDPDNHLMFYSLEYAEPPPVWNVKVDNQFGVNQELWVQGPVLLGVPTKKGEQDPPMDLDHYLVYEVLDYTNTPTEVYVNLADQFNEQIVNVYEPILFANPVRKTHGTEVTGIKHEDDHLLLYWIDGGDFWLSGLSIENQFGPQSLNVYQDVEDFLGVPSIEVEWSLVA